MKKSGEIKDMFGNKTYWLNGVLHNSKGPAIELINGDKEWWVNGEFEKEEKGETMHNGENKGRNIR